MGGGIHQAGRAGAEAESVHVAGVEAAQEWVDEALRHLGPEPAGDELAD